MALTPGRAPFTEDEDYTPLRNPKSATNTPTHGNSYSGGGVSVMGGMGGVDAVLSGPPAGVSDPYGRTESPSKLSPYAKEFVPRSSTAVGNAALEQQQQYNQQNYSQYQQQPQQRYANGYQQHHGNHHNQNHHSQSSMYAAPISSLTTSVQERLKIGGGGGGGGGGSNSGGGGGGGGNKNAANNYYHQQQHHPHQHQHQHQNQHQARHSNYHHSHHQHQSRYKQQHQHGSSSGGGGGGRHQHHGNSSGGASGSGSGSSGAADVETIALDYLQTVIQCLNQNPGQFDSIATRFLTIFEGMENNQYVLSNAMEDIFQESIQNPNFRYMGAKLYNLLHMLNLKKDSLFHTLLKCKLDYHQQEVLQYMQTNQQQKVRETALFLAELYMQLRGDDSRIHLIAENIVYSLKQLLSKESTDNVRCICLTLKLAGYDLTADCPTDMEAIIAKLDAINVQSPGKYPLAANVISLQKNNWGRKASTSPSESETPKTPEPGRASDEPVFYGPDGRELTAEETAFLTDGAAAMAGGSTDEDLEDGADLDVDLDPEMDEETEKAYKEFCKLNAST